MNTLMKKCVLLYTSYRGYSRNKYYVPTDDELKRILEVTDEILLIPIAIFNRFTDKNGNDYEVITRELIDNMTPDMVGDPSRLETIKKDIETAKEKENVVVEEAPKVRATFIDLEEDEVVEDKVEEEKVSE